MPGLRRGNIRPVSSSKTDGKLVKARVTARLVVVRAKSGDMSHRVNPGAVVSDRVVPLMSTDNN